MTGAIGFAPLIPWQVVAAAGGLGLLLAVLALARGARGALWRALSIALLCSVLLNPKVVSEEREARPDIAVVVVDESASQRIGERRDKAEAALKDIRDSLKRFDNLDVRVVRSKGDATADASGFADGTNLFADVAQALGEVQEGRLAGVLLITDGQVHDIPGEADAAIAGPVHVLLTGERGEKDRRLSIERAPSYGIVGNKVSVYYRVRDNHENGAGNRTQANVALRVDGEDISSVPSVVGAQGRFTFELSHAGPTVVELEVEPIDGELSALNNRAVVSINGVRDRLKVLLISGQPHAGERTWRNLLKSDPSVDLVHFTILRPPEKDDMTPINELALIVFPVHELFEVKLKDFDLVVFDRYIVRDVLPPSYFRNIDNHVRDGGALLLAAGPEFASDRSLYSTGLSKSLPGEPTGKVIEQGYRPRITGTGRRHPVTAELTASDEGSERWGRWFRQIETVPRGGVELMKGVGDRSLLLLDRIGKGRIAQMNSDHIWLWARGYEGGGPQGELLRRLSHWLMKEPDLEEEKLSASVRGGRLEVSRRSLDPSHPEVTVTAPSGETGTLTLKEEKIGVGRATLPITEAGVYRVEDGEKTAFAAAGALNPKEYSDLRTTEDRLRPVTTATGGGTLWLGDGKPQFRRVHPGRDMAGRGWMGLQENRAFAVTGVAETPLMPGLLLLALLLSVLGMAWWREGH